MGLAMKKSIAFVLTVLFLGSVFVSCSWFSKSDQAGDIRPAGLRSCGPIFTFSDSDLREIALTYYTETETTDTVILLLDDTNFILKDSRPRRLHEHYVKRSGDTVDYHVYSSDAVVDGRHEMILLPGTNGFRMVVYGDTRTRLEVHARVCEAIVSNDPSVVLNTGDLVENGDDPAGWSSFFESGRKVFDHSFYIPVNGNHDHRADMLYRFFHPPVAGAYNFVYRFPGMLLVVLDTEDEFTEGSVQYGWLTKVLAAETNANAVKTVVFHRPPFASSFHYGDPQTRQLQAALVPVFEKYGVKLVLNGHEHLYERSVKNGIQYVTTGGGGAPEYTDDFPNPYRVKKILGSPHFMVLDVGNGSVSVRVLRLDNTEMDGFTVR